jgi:hypothetical protein
MHSRTNRRRFRKVNFFSFASKRQFSSFSARSRLAAAISPGDFAFGEGDGRTLRHRYLRRRGRGGVRPAARSRQWHPHHRARHATAGDLRSRKLCLPAWPHRRSLSHLPGAGTARIRAVDRTDGTRRGGGFVTLQSRRLGGVAPALARRPSRRSSCVAGRVSLPSVTDSVSVTSQRRPPARLVARLWRDITESGLFLSAGGA